MKSLLILTSLLISGGLLAESTDEELINRMLIAEIVIDKCIEAKDCFELMKGGGPMMEVIYDTDLTDALNRCTDTPKITKCSQIMGRVSMKTFETIEYMIK